MLAVQLSDPHVNPIGQRYPRLYGGQLDTAALLQRAVRTINALAPRPDIVLLTGDIAALDGQPGDYAAAADALAELAIPWLAVPGNHDRRNAMRAAFGAACPFDVADGFLNCRHRVGDVTLLGLDTLDEGKGSGLICGDRLTWLERAIADTGDVPVVLFMHHPPFETGWPFADPIRAQGGDALAALVARRANVQAVLCGHLHRSITRRFAGTIGYVAPAATRQGYPALGAGTPHRWTEEPPAFVQHLWHGGALSSFVTPIEPAPRIGA